MSKKLFVCSECGYVFPEQLSHLIEQNIQVYCEKYSSYAQQDRYVYAQTHL